MGIFIAVGVPDSGILTKFARTAYRMPKPGMCTQIAKATAEAEQDIRRKKYIFFDDNDNDREDLFRREKKTPQRGKGKRTE